MDLGYPKIELHVYTCIIWLSKVQHDFWMSKNIFKDIQKCLRISKINYGYPKTDLWISINICGYHK